VLDDDDVDYGELPDGSARLPLSTTSHPDFRDDEADGIDLVEGMPLDPNRENWEVIQHEIKIFRAACDEESRRENPHLVPPWMPTIAGPRWRWYDICDPKLCDLYGGGGFESRDEALRDVLEVFRVTRVDH
jgi:hypothetical protein